MLSASKCSTKTSVISSSDVTNNWRDRESNKFVFFRTQTLTCSLTAPPLVVSSSGTYFTLRNELQATPVKQSHATKVLKTFPLRKLCTCVREGLFYNVSLHFEV